VFSRIHVDDIANILVNSMLNLKNNQIYNVCDDLPASTNEVIEYAARLLNIPTPPRIAIEDNKLSEMVKEFYSNNKRVKNNKIKTTLGINLIYPTYKEGLKSMYEKREY
jgi:dTDP-4-dehydrorhamnose reductase